MSILISDDIIKKSRFSEGELKTELAAWLYDKEIFTLAQAARFANLTRLAFQKELAKRNIFLKISAEDVLDDARTLQSLNLL